MSDEVTLVGIMAEREFEALFMLRDLKKIIFDTLQLGPMFDPLVSVLKSSGKLEGDQTTEEGWGLCVAKYSEILEAINSNDFLQITPRVSVLRYQSLVVRKRERNLFKHQTDTYSATHFEERVLTE